MYTFRMTYNRVENKIHQTYDVLIFLYVNRQIGQVLRDKNLNVLNVLVLERICIQIKEKNFLSLSLN